MGSAVRRARCAALATGRARSHPDWPRRQASSASSSPGRRAGRSDAGPSAAGRSSHLVRPLDAGVLVGVSVLEASNLARLAAEHAEKVGALLVGAALVAGVAGGALCLEDLGARLGLAVVGTRHSCLVFCQAANSDVWSSAGGVSPRFGRQRRPQWAARRLHAAMVRRQHPGHLAGAVGQAAAQASSGALRLDQNLFVDGVDRAARRRSLRMAA